MYSEGNIIVDNVEMYVVTLVVRIKNTFPVIKMLKYESVYSATRKI